MNQEESPAQIEETTMSMDDMSVLRVLLHNIHGIKPVSGNPLQDFLALEEETTDI